MKGLQDALTELRARREKLDQVIAAIEDMLGPVVPASDGSVSVATTRTKKAAARPGRRSGAGESTRDLVIAALRSGPKRAGGVVKALKGKANDTAVYAMLNYLKAHGEVRKNEDATFQLVKE